MIEYHDNVKVENKIAKFHFLTGLASHKGAKTLSFISFLYELGVLARGFYETQSCNVITARYVQE